MSDVKETTVNPDVLNGRTLEVKPLDGQPNSFVRLVDVMPRFGAAGNPTGDYAIVQAARVSYGDGTKTPSDDRTLIRYLLRNKHTTPFEMCEVKFHMMMPMASARQHIRHRTANVNEYSARYSTVRDLYYIPEVDNMRNQSKSNKQAGETVADEMVASWFQGQLEENCKRSYALYEEASKKGIAREQARYALPVNYNTEWYWKCDLWNIMNFLRLRMDAHAQEEIRVVANAMYALIKPVFPVAMEAFDDYIFGAMSLSRLDIERLAKGQLATPYENKREESEFQSKIKKLGYVVSA